MKKIKFQDINYLLMEADFEGLIRFGAPLDEYRSEAIKFYNSLKNCNNHPEYKYVECLVQYIFYHQFHREIMPFQEWIEKADLDIMKLTLEICQLMDD